LRREKKIKKSWGKTQNKSFSRASRGTKKEKKKVGLTEYIPASAGTGKRKRSQKVGGRGGKEPEQEQARAGL